MMTKPLCFYTCASPAGLQSRSLPPSLDLPHQCWRAMLACAMLVWIMLTLLTLLPLLPLLTLRTLMWWRADVVTVAAAALRLCGGGGERGDGGGVQHAREQAAVGQDARARAAAHVCARGGGRSRLHECGVAPRPEVRPTVCFVLCAVMCFGGFGNDTGCVCYQDDAGLHAHVRDAEADEHA
eukprot:878732-Rhodomonas_salina.2